MITGKKYNYEMRLNITSVTIAGKNIPVNLNEYSSLYAIKLDISTDEEGSRNMQGAGVKEDEIIIKGTCHIQSNGEYIGSWNMNVEAHEVE